MANAPESWKRHLLTYPAISRQPYRVRKTRSRFRPCSAWLRFCTDGPADPIDRAEGDWYVRGKHRISADFLGFLFGLFLFLLMPANPSLFRSLPVSVLVMMCFGLVGALAGWFIAFICRTAGQSDSGTEGTWGQRKTRGRVSLGVLLGVRPSSNSFTGLPGLLGVRPSPGG